MVSTTRVRVGGDPMRQGRSGAALPTPAQWGFDPVGPARQDDHVVSLTPAAVICERSESVPRSGAPAT